MGIQNIYGCCIVGKKEYTDDEIKDLIGKKIPKWKYGGDQSDEESNFLIVLDNGKSYCFGYPDKDALQQTLAFISQHQ